MLKRIGDQLQVLSCGRAIIYKYRDQIFIVKNKIFVSIDRMAIAFAILNNISCIFCNRGIVTLFPALDDNGNKKVNEVLYVTGNPPPDADAPTPGTVGVPIHQNLGQPVSGIMIGGARANPELFNIDFVRHPQMLFELFKYKYKAIAKHLQYLKDYREFYDFYPDFGNEGASTKVRYEFSNKSCLTTLTNLAPPAAQEELDIFELERPAPAPVNVTFDLICNYPVYLKSHDGSPDYGFRVKFASGDNQLYSAKRLTNDNEGTKGYNWELRHPALRGISRGISNKITEGIIQLGGGKHRQVGGAKKDILFEALALYQLLLLNNKEERESQFYKVYPFSNSVDYMIPNDIEAYVFIMKWLNNDYEIDDLIPYLKTKKDGEKNKEAILATIIYNFIKNIYNYLEIEPDEEASVAADEEAVAAEVADEEAVAAAEVADEEKAGVAAAADKESGAAATKEASVAATEEASVAATEETTLKYDDLLNTIVKELPKIKREVGYGLQSKKNKKGLSLVEAIFEYGLTPISFLVKYIEKNGDNVFKEIRPIFGKYSIDGITEDKIDQIEGGVISIIKGGESEDPAIAAVIELIKEEIGEELFEKLKHESPEELNEILGFEKEDLILYLNPSENGGSSIELAQEQASDSAAAPPMRGALFNNAEARGAGLFASKSSNLDQTFRGEAAIAAGTPLFVQTKFPGFSYGNFTPASLRRGSGASGKLSNSTITGSRTRRESVVSAGTEYSGQEGSFLNQTALSAADAGTATPSTSGRLTPSSGQGTAKTFQIVSEQSTPEKNGEGVNHTSFRGSARVRLGPLARRLSFKQNNILKPAQPELTFMENTLGGKGRKIRRKTQLPVRSGNHAKNGFLTRRRKQPHKHKSKKARKEPKKLSKRNLTRSTMRTRHDL